MASRAGHALAAALALAGLTVAGALICMHAAAGETSLVPASWHGMPGWMSGPLPSVGDGLTRGTFSALFVTMCGCYLVALALAHDAGARAIVAAIVVLHALFMLAPPLLSSDVFGYIDWARLGTIHGLDPYAHGSLAAPDDPAFRYFRWRTDMPSPYGPVFTVASYATAPLGVAGAMWAFKVATAAASLGCVALAASCARRLGRDPLRAAAFVGLNPIVLAWTVGGAHNDLLAMVVVMGGVRLAIGGRERASAAALATAVAVKASAAVVLPYALIGARDRRRALAGAGLAVAGAVALAFAVFGADAPGFVEANRDQQRLVAHNSIPNQLGLLVGADGITPAIRVLAGAVLAAVVGWTIVSARRGGDWIACAGWATLALIACSAWLMPWYVAWLLPLAAVARDRRLAAGALLMCAYLVVMRTPF